MMQTTMASGFFFLFAFNPSVSGTAFLGGPQHSHHTELGSDNALQAAMDAMMGCGGEIDRPHLAAVERAIEPMWRTLPKLDDGKVLWPALRFMAHRYFMQRSNLLVRGFEPVRLVNASSRGHAEILNKHAPHFVEVLQDKHAERGFSIEDAAALVATLEQLMFESDSLVLDRAYRHEHLEPQHRLGHTGVYRVLETYLVHWLLGDDEESLQFILSNRTVLSEVFPNWDSIREFLQGRIRTLNFARYHTPAPQHARSTMLGTYTFEDVLDMVAGIGSSFASFWESECRSMKAILVELDQSGTGRIPLSRFYAAALGSEWRFSESEAYLRDVGVLDESSKWLGMQVLIPNYLQGASNCIVSTAHYHVCCANECDEILREIEAEIGTPDALPHQILQVVKNITSPSSKDDELPKLNGAFTAQLERLAEVHDGKVPLHSRLFAQWLHYVYPRECVFPHKSGTRSTVTPAGYGNSHLATESEMRKHTSDIVNTSHVAELEDKDEEGLWMSQKWSKEEDALFTEYGAELHAPWEVCHSFATLGAAAAFMLAVWVALKRWDQQSQASGELGFNPVEKSHLV